MGRGHPVAEAAVAEISDEEIKMLGEALDGLLTATEGVSTEVRATIEVLREQRETT
jgi:hypothetical protein